jgi:hypothetical protein
MRERDKNILRDLERFRVLSRDDVADLYFSDLKNPAKMANHVLKRLWRDGYITANTERSPYVYFLNPAPIRKDSSKINHYLEIVKFYREIKRVKEPTVFYPEWSPGKGYMQADAFMIWQGIAFYIEIQRTFYTPKQMKEKLDKYEAYYQSGKWGSEAWQGDKIVFPSVNIITKEEYTIEDKPFLVNQFSTIEEFVQTTNHAIMKRQWAKPVQK